jgi:hypothetical protein
MAGRKSLVAQLYAAHQKAKLERRTKRSSDAAVAQAMSLRAGETPPRSETCRRNRICGGRDAVATRIARLRHFNQSAFFEIPAGSL